MVRGFQPAAVRCLGQDIACAPVCRWGVVALAGSACGAGGPARLPPCLPLRCGGFWSLSWIAGSEGNDGFWAWGVSNVLGKTLEGACDRAFFVMRGAEAVQMAREARSAKVGRQAPTPS